jgi:biopolymer transport protein ExbD
MSAFLAILLVLWITVVAWKHIGECSFVSAATSVDLVHAQNATPHPNADREDAITVTIKHDGKIYFRSLSVSQKKLKDQIAEGVREGAEPRVYLNVDRRAQYGCVQEVLTVVRSAGIAQITLITNNQLNTEGAR